ncbi:MAG TPA: DapH/DapD/GlmU-related protein [Terriglobales bacterium]
MVKRLTKLIVHALGLVLTAPAALLCGFGRIEPVFIFFAQSFAMVPGLPGDYLRVCYYVLTLRECHLNCRISFGSFIAQSATWIGPGAYIGAYCVIGSSRIGSRTQIASHVQVLSGKHQHERDDQGRILGADTKTFVPINIGENCWLGASTVIMADIGNGTTIGAGSVVTRPIPEGVVAVGSPAQVVKKAAV